MLQSLIAAPEAPLRQRLKSDEEIVNITTQTNRLGIEIIPEK